MKTKINYITMLMFSLYVLVSENAFSQAIYVHLYDDVWAVCPEGDKNGDGNLTSADGCYHAIIKQTLVLDGGGGGAGISIPADPIPDDPFTPPITGGGSSPVPSNPTDPSINDGNTNIEPKDPSKIGDKTDPILPPICHCNVCPYCGGCILEEGESLPAGCEKKCECIRYYGPCVEVGVSHEITKNAITYSLIEGQGFQGTSFIKGGYWVKPNVNTNGEIISYYVYVWLEINQPSPEDYTYISSANIFVDGIINGIMNFDMPINYLPPSNELWVQLGSVQFNILPYHDFDMQIYIGYKYKDFRGEYNGEYMNQKFEIVPCID